MLQNIKNTFKHSFIYSLGNIGTKLIGVILLPLYTKHITVADYGVLGILEVTIMILTQTLTLGQPQALLRFYHSGEFQTNRKAALFSILCTVFVSGFSVTFLLISFAPFLASLFENPTSFTVYFRLSFTIIMLRVLTLLFLTFLRAKERSVYFVLSNITKILLILFFSIYFVAIIQIGVKGILYSYLNAESVLFLILLPSVLKELTPKIERKILYTALGFGFPLIFNSLAGMLLKMGDRYILKLLANYRELGLYVLGNQFAGLINVLLIQSFSLGFIPIAFKLYGQEGDKRYYSKIMTYFIFILSWAGLGLATFSRELVEFFALDQSFWSAYRVIPVLTLSYIILGGRAVLNISLLVKNKTTILAVMTIIATFINFVLNFILIPPFGMMGAAYATLISFLILYILTYYYSQNVYAIPYEKLKIFGLISLGILLYFFSTFTHWLDLGTRITLKIMLVFIFPLILYLFNFYEGIEILRLREELNAWLNKIYRKDKQ